MTSLKSGCAWHPLTLTFGTMRSMMQPGTAPRQRDVYQGPVPFADKDIEKVRPVLILTSTISNAHWKDVLVMAVTSKTETLLPGVVIDSTSFEHGGLPFTSKLIPLRIFSLSPSRLGRYLGRLKAEPFERAL